MSDKFILAIDQGTTGTTVLAVSPTLEVLAKVNHEFPQIFPKEGWVEHSAEDIWSSLKSASLELFNKTGLEPKNISAIGITNQRETTCLFNKGGHAIHNFIVWQCRRTQEICQRLKDAGHEDYFKQTTGLVLDPYFSGTKLRWLFENIEESKNVYQRADKGELLFGTIDTWLVHRLSAGKVHVTDATNASRTLLMDLESCEWDQKCLDILDIPRACLPKICSSSEVYGETCDLDFLPDGIPIAGIAGDQQAALFGQACFEVGEAKCTFGTGCFLLMNTGSEIIHSNNGLLTTVAIQIGDKTSYALEGSAFIAGAAVQWLRDNLGMIEQASDIEVLASKVDSSGEVVFVPALAGLGAPHWRPEARGALMGLSRKSNKSHIARATLEGIALQNRDVLQAMSKDGAELESLKVDGGASQNNILMQFQADILGVDCVRPQVVETTALGAAALAGLAVGIFKSADQIKSTWQEDRTFKSEISAEERLKHVKKWEKAVKSCF